jgi:hypothetical protein
MVAMGAALEDRRIWTEAADTEARNALQVILSGSEMLLDNIFGRLSPVQKEMLEKMLASAHHLNGIITPLANPCEIVVDDTMTSAYLQSAGAVLEKM